MYSRALWLRMLPIVQHPRGYDFFSHSSNAGAKSNYKNKNVITDKLAKGIGGWLNYFVIYWNKRIDLLFMAGKRNSIDST